MTRRGTAIASAQAMLAHMPGEDPPKCLLTPGVTPHSERPAENKTSKKKKKIIIIFCIARINTQGPGLFSTPRRLRLRALPLDQSNMTLMCFYSRLTRRRDESLGRRRRIRRLPLISRDGARRRRAQRLTPRHRRGGSGH